MTKLIGIAGAAALLAGTAGPVAAQAFNGAAKITRGDYAKAEHDLVAQRGLYPEAVDLMLNLATVYAHTGRPQQARALYQQAAAQPEEDVILRNGAYVSSRVLAQRGMAQIPAVVAIR